PRLGIPPDPALATTARAGLHRARGVTGRALAVAGREPGRQPVGTRQTLQHRFPPPRRNVGGLTGLPIGHLGPTEEIGQFARSITTHGGSSSASTARGPRARRW